MSRTHLTPGAKMAATAHYLRENGLSDTLEPLGDAVSLAIAKKILLRIPIGKGNSWPLLAKKSPVAISCSDRKQWADWGSSVATRKSIQALELHCIVKNVVVEVLDASLGAQTDQGRRLRMALIEQLASQERTGKWVTVPHHGAAARAEASDALITTAEVASLLQVSRPYVAMLCDSGKLGEVTRTEGGHRRIRQSAVEAYLAERTEASRDAVAPREAGIDAGLYARSDEEYVNRVREEQRSASKNRAPRAPAKRGSGK